MNYSILNQVYEYIKENGIAFKSIYISSSYFPKAFNDAVYEKIFNLKGHSNFKLDKYELYYNDDKLQLVAKDNFERTAVVICNHELGCSYDKPIFNSRYNEYVLLDKVNKLEEKRINDINNLIKEYGLNDRCNINFDPIDIALDKSTSLICNYINYLNEEYKKVLKENNILEIKYNKPESSTIIRRNPTDVVTSVKERVNEVLPIDDRRRILESYDYIYSGYAYSSSNKNIEYLCYLYLVDDNKYAIVMEPIAGNTYTKTHIFEYNDIVTSEYFSNLVSNCLSLSYEEYETDNILITKHTSLDLFDSVIENILTGNDKKSRICHFTKKRILNLRGRKEQ